MEVLDITLEEITGFLNKYPEYKREIQVKGRKGFYPIIEAGITEKNSKIISVCADNLSKYKIEGSPNHRVIVDDKWTKLKDLKADDKILTDEGYFNISIKDLDFKEDLYDIEVAEVHEYYSNGIVSHNSSQSDALFYGLFGKPFRKIKNGSLINDVANKGLMVEVYFSIGDLGNSEVHYKIERGQKKNIFIIYKKIDGDYVEIPEKATTREYQIFLEEEILKMNDTVFRQLISISANLDSSKSFMDLTPKEKESLFQVVTDTSIFNDLSDKIKLRIQDTKLKQKDIDYELKVTEASIESEKIMIEQAKKQNENFLKHHKDNIKHTKESIRDTEANVQKYKEGIKKLKELKESYDLMNIELMAYKQTLTDFNMEVQEITENELQKTIGNYDTNIKKLDDWYYNLENTEYKGLNEQKMKAYEKISDNKQKISELNAKITHIQAAKKGSIKCKKCDSVNYLVDITEDEIISLTEYQDLVDILINKNIKLKNDMDILDSNLMNIKEQNKIDYSTRKKALTDEKEKELKIIKDKQYSHKHKERDEIQDKINNIEKILETYKEKLLKSKHIKNTLKENEDLVEYYIQKLRELEAVELVEIDEDSLNSKIEHRDLIKTDLSTQNKTLQDLNYLMNMLSDKGENNLKGQVIARTVPFLNKGINYFLEAFSLNEFNFVIDENFKEKIISRESHSEFNSLSNGQKMRISFSILFSFLRLIEEKNGITTNLLFLDEILDGSLDTNGREELLYILKNEFSKKKNVIIISHNEQIKEKVEVFDRSIQVKRDKFSSLSIQDIK